MKVNQIVTLEKKITPILKSNDVEFAGVFGSFARGEEKPDSDIDIVVRFSPQKRVGFIALIGLEQTLSGILDRKVDLLTERGIHPYIKEYVSKDLKILYGQRQSI